MSIILKHLFCQEHGNERDDLNKEKKQMRKILFGLLMAIPYVAFLLYIIWRW
jgi:hypothetical protein